jgi:threonine dehydratase
MTHIPALHDVYRAHARIKPMILQTPLLASTELAEKTGARSVSLKAGMFAEYRGLQGQGRGK